VRLEWRLSYHVYLTAISVTGKKRDEGEAVPTEHCTLLKKTKLSPVRTSSEGHLRAPQK
jgi:hypothetical protein